MLALHSVQAFRQFRFISVLIHHVHSRSDSSIDLSTVTLVQWHAQADTAKSAPKIIRSVLEEAGASQMAGQLILVPNMNLNINCIAVVLGHC